MRDKDRKNIVVKNLVFTRPVGFSWSNSEGMNVRASLWNKEKPGELCTSVFCLPLFIPFRRLLTNMEWPATDTERKQEALGRAAERVGLNVERDVLAAQR